MNKRHKHYDVIVAWADGKAIQFKGRDWFDWANDCPPSFDEDMEYRIKPEPDVVKEWRTNKYGELFVNSQPNLRLTFDGETGELKRAEVIE